MRTTVAAATPRLSADERRDDVLEAATAEFTEHGFHAARTTAIARRAGISQPYIYALFPSKKALFLAVHSRVVARIREQFAAAAVGAASPGDALRRMSGAFLAMLGERDELLCQLQGYAACGDPEIRDHVRAEFTGLFDAVAEIAGASRDDVALFTAGGMFFTVAGALDVPAAYWPHAPYGEDA
jgi:AcrR family transcriptional regulator